MPERGSAFIDRATIRVRGGRGGDGCVSFRRERFLPRGGPDGGDGGDGGSVYVAADPQMTTLFDMEHRPLWRAEDGKPGGGSNRTGRSGRDLYIHVPCGTQVYVVPREDLPAYDLVQPGQTALVARGGKGGRGNRALASSVNQAPREAEGGTCGEEKVLRLELKLIAQVGLVGLPNAGKSTLLRRLSRATPKVASYPFTTLHPHLGVVRISEDRSLVVADIPGLIEGAHRGAGLGVDFLRHIERTQAVAHLVSCEGGSAERLFQSWEAVQKELASYSPLLVSKVRLAVLTKIDLCELAQRDALLRECAARFPCPVMGISAVTGEGLREFRRTLPQLLGSSPSSQ